MIKMSATNPKTGRKLIILGVEDNNLNQLRRGRPIHIHGDKLGFDGDIVIHYETTMAKLVKTFRPFIGPETRVTDSSGEKKN